MIHSYLQYLYDLKHFRTKLKLEGMEQLMEVLDHPYRNYKTIHVGGTNGKGSTCAFMESILRKAGYKVGLYTSPHLLEYNERIQINGEKITDEELASLVAEVRQTLEENELTTTFFEMTTVIAFLYFARKKIDIAVIEVGLGGRLDATNVITPLVAAITNVSLEHTQILGNTIEQIAREKAGIVKQNVPLVTAEEKPEALQVFKEKCREIDSQLQIVNTQEDSLHYSLLGEHQRKNAAVAVRVIKELRQQGMVISEEAVQNGLLEAKWPGRIQVVSEEPLIIVDCAHNVEGIQNLLSYIRKLSQRKKVLVFATASDKNSQEMARLIVPLFERVIVTEGNFRPKSAQQLAEEIKDYAQEMEIIADCREAVREAQTGLQKDDLLLVTGSIYMVGDALKYLQQQGHEQIQEQN